MVVVVVVVVTTVVCVAGAKENWPMEPDAVACASLSSILLFVVALRLRYRDMLAQRRVFEAVETGPLSSSLFKSRYTSRVLLSIMREEKKLDSIDVVEEVSSLGSRQNGGLSA